MEFLKTVVAHPAFWGFCGGFFFFILSFVSHWKTKREFRRFQKHLTDKLELEARQFEMVRREKEELSKENENLRLRIGQLNEKPDHKIARDIEILVRAEKRMMMSAPGFAPAWETAKAEAAREMGDEERGKSIPKRLFTKLFGVGDTNVRDVESTPLLESGGENGRETAGTESKAGAAASHESGRS